MNRFNCLAERAREAINLRPQPVDQIARTAFRTSARGICQSGQHISFRCQLKNRGLSTARTVVGFQQEQFWILPPTGKPPVPKGRPIIARPFSGRVRRHQDRPVPEERLRRRQCFSRASGTGLVLGAVLSQVNWRAIFSGASGTVRATQHRRASLDQTAPSTPLRAGSGKLSPHEFRRSPRV